MKKMLMIVMIGLSLPFVSKAQEFHGGLKGGLNITNLYIDDVTDENARVGFNAGVYGKWTLGDVIGIQPELLYSTKGTKAEYDVAVFEGENKFNLHYLDIPVLAVFSLNEHFEIHAGPYFSYLLGASVSTEGDLGDDVDQLDRDNFSEGDFGLAGGVAFGSEEAKIGVRYNYGLKEIADSDAAREMIGDAKNSALQIYVSFGF